MATSKLKGNITIIGVFLIALLIIVAFNFKVNQYKYAVIENERYKLLFPHESKEKINITLQAEPVVRPMYRFQSITYSLNATAKDSEGNKVSKLDNAFKVTIDFSGLDISNYKKETIAIYQSTDGNNWTKLSTNVDFDKKMATSESSQFGTFALVGERSGIKVSPYYKGDDRIVYDFEKIFRIDFLEYRNDLLGFAINRPEEIEIYEYSPEEAQGKSFSSTNRKVKGAVNFSLASQLASGTELFDGLSIDIIAYENASHINLRQFVEEETKYMDEPVNEGNRIDSTRSLKIGDTEATEVIILGWGGETLSYYLEDPERQRMFEIGVFSAGQDKESFDKVAQRMVQTFKFLP